MESHMILEAAAELENRALIKNNPADLMVSGIILLRNFNIPQGILFQT